MKAFRLLVPLLALWPAFASAEEPPPKISDARNDDGILVHDVTCPFQKGTTQIRVLLPEPMQRSRLYPVIYVLPVERLDESRFGDGLRHIKAVGLHKRHAAIFVMPTFSHLPWYADHPTKAEIRQETYLLKVVIPFIDKTYPIRDEARNRHLLGFSKSGWGAWSLLLRHPASFGRAAAWDAPLMKEKPDQFGMGDIFGTQENFEAYQITRLLQKRPGPGDNERLILLGYGNFRVHHQQMHELMTRLKVPHAYEDGPSRKHNWDSGWLADAVKLLLAERKEGDVKR